MDYIEIIGLLAAICTTLAFVPQVVKTWQSKSAKDLSLGMFLLFFVGVCLWLSYGLLIGNRPIIVANLVTGLLAGTILFFKARYK
ncbi:SemiSWEET transporter [Cytophagales bacterium LB-30]|uniref:SemiSWEET transporter n=1 Tax=Shiella aurantiaca TaxID=3058365 RepID=A0ABT8F8P9_9BACT|nr:SemiSWEET transporter [Shiella aurantiaca]MDN4166855.1 SemiSWEET transporter [Shiella aurantiaca]